MIPGKAMSPLRRGQNKQGAGSRRGVRLRHPRVLGLLLALLVQEPLFAEAGWTGSRIMREAFSRHDNTSADSSALERSAALRTT